MASASSSDSKRLLPTPNKRKEKRWLNPKCIAVKTLDEKKTELRAVMAEMTSDLLKSERYLTAVLTGGEEACHIWSEVN